jgi:hypothetical protein
MTCRARYRRSKATAEHTCDPWRDVNPSNGPSLGTPRRYGMARAGRAIASRQGWPKIPVRAPVTVTGGVALFPANLSEGSRGVIAGPGGQRHRIERLGDNTGRAQRHVMLDVAGFRAGGHEDDRNLDGRGPFPQARQGRRTVHIGHHDVKQDKVGGPIRGRREGISSRSAAADREIRVEPERQLDHLSDVRLVVDMKDPNPAHFASLSGVGAIHLART